MSEIDISFVLDMKYYCQIEVGSYLLKMLQNKALKLWPMLHNILDLG